MKIKTLVVFLTFAITTSQALADKVKVGVINLKPWGSVSTNREIVGQHIDLFDELSKRSGLSFQYQILSIPRIKESLKMGEIDMTVIFQREEMAPYVNFIGLVMPYNYYLVGKKGTSFDKAKVSSLKKVGYIEGEEDVAKKCFSDQYNPTAKMLSAPDYGDLLKMLNKDRFGGATIPSKGLKAYLDEIGQGHEFVSQLFILCKNEAYLQTSRKSTTLKPDDMQSLRRSLASMRQDGTIERIAAKYSELD